MALVCQCTQGGAVSTSLVRWKAGSSTPISGSPTLLYLASRLRNLQVDTQADLATAYALRCDPAIQQDDRGQRRRPLLHEAHRHLMQMNGELVVAAAEWLRHPKTPVERRRARFKPHNSLMDVQSSRGQLVGHIPAGERLVVERPCSDMHAPLALQGLEGAVEVAFGR